MKRNNQAPNGVRIDAHDKFSATMAMAEHIKATDGNIQRCEERTDHIWQVAHEALNADLEYDPQSILAPRSYYAMLNGLEEQAANVLHYKNGDLPKAKTLFKLWWKSALESYEIRNKATAHFKDKHPEMWTASQKAERDSLLMAAARYEQQAKECYAEAKALGAEIPTTTSPERVKELRSIMQKNHPDRGGDADVFQAAKVELAAIRAA